MIGAVVATAFARLLLAWFSQRFVMAVGHDLAVSIFARMLRQPFPAYSRRSSSEILSGVEKVQLIVNEALQPVMQGLIAAFIALLIIALLFAIDAFTASIAAATLLLVYAAISLATRRRLQRNSAVIAKTGTARIKLVQEGLGEFATSSSTARSPCSTRNSGGSTR